jgi:hypothetical protein
MARSANSCVFPFAAAVHVVVFMSALLWTAIIVCGLAVPGLALLATAVGLGLCQPWGLGAWAWAVGSVTALGAAGVLLIINVPVNAWVASGIAAHGSLLNAWVPGVSKEFCVQPWTCGPQLRWCSKWAGAGWRACLVLAVLAATEALVFVGWCSQDDVPMCRHGVWQAGVLMTLGAAVAAAALRASQACCGGAMLPPDPDGAWDYQGTGAGTGSLLGTGV